MLFQVERKGRKAKVTLYMEESLLKAIDVLLRSSECNGTARQAAAEALQLTQ